jgi:acetyl esterase/lipase
MTKITTRCAKRSPARIAAVTAALATSLLASVACSNTGDSAASVNTIAPSTTPLPKVTVTTQPRAPHTYPHITATTTFADIIDDPAFAGFGMYMSPAEDSATVQALRAANIEVLHAAVDDLKNWEPQTIVDGLNFMIDQVNTGETVWYPLYNDKDTSTDESKKSAGMWFIPGDPNQPLAVVAAGGGFRSVESLQEAFPYAQQLNEKGYNVAILKYRVNPPPPSEGPPTSGQSTAGSTPGSSPGDGDQEQAIQRATDDMAAAMRILRDNPDIFPVSLRNYSVWGSSAGGQVVSAWAGDGSNGANAHGFDQPAVVIDAYTPVRGFEASKTFPPLFDVFNADDPIGSTGTDAFVDQLKANGAPVEEEKFPAGGHGFGLGVGMLAAGWLDRAVDFWHAHVKS